MRFNVRRILLWPLLLVFVVALSLVGGRYFYLKSREKRPATSCLSHLKQIGLAMFMYAADYEGRLPNASTWPADLRAH